MAHNPEHTLMASMTLQDIGILFAVVTSLLGWVYQLGYSGARLGRNERDIAELRKGHEQSRRDRAAEIKELQEHISEGLERIYGKLDKLPCKNPGWTPKDCS
jgi:Tfp pilus assembly protein PilO